MVDKLYVGFGHKARQGKDSIARLINQQYPALTKIIGFADALKVYCRVAHGMTEKNGSLLQTIGVAKRHEDPDFWINILKWTAQDYPNPIILIPDVRFPNEVQFIDDADGGLVRVRRILADGTQFVPTDRDPQHESETALDDYAWPLTIDIPDGNLAALRMEGAKLGAAIVKSYNERCRQRYAVEGPRVTLH